MHVVNGQKQKRRPSRPKQVKEKLADVKCEVCDCAMHPKILQKHLESKKHRRKLACGVCKVQTDSLTALASHKEGAEHLAAVLAHQLAREEKQKNKKDEHEARVAKRKLQGNDTDGDLAQKKVRVKGLYSCEVCGIADFTSEKQQQVHLSGSKHAAKLAAASAN